MCISSVNIYERSPLVRLSLGHELTEAINHLQLSSSYLPSNPVVRHVNSLDWSCIEFIEKGEKRHLVFTSFKLKQLPIAREDCITNFSIGNLKFWGSLSYQELSCIHDM